MTRLEIERILQSDTFRSSGVLRRLLRYLAEKSLAGEADQLKEYSIGLDAFGKPPTYDPRSDAIVRLQAGRLRQKLTDYYRIEGKDDAIVVDLPKGHFKLTWQARPPAPPADVAPAAAIPPVPLETARARPASPWLIALLATALAASVFLNILSAVTSRPPTTGALSPAQFSAAPWTPELRELWGPFISSRPIVVAFADPLFVGVLSPDGNVIAQLRLNGINDWDSAAGSRAVQSLRRAYGNLAFEPRFNFAGRGYLDSALRLGRLLGASQSRLSVARLSQVSWQVLSDNNALLVSTQASTPDQMLLALPAKPELMLDKKGVLNLHPRQGEPDVYADDEPATVDGEIYALASVVAGPVGATRIGSFTSNRFWGNAGAIEAFTDPTLARLLVQKLKGTSGRLPSYYQILFRVKYRDGVPTDVSYITHRELPALPVTSTGRE